ncbi:MAG: type II toxin-antitoxin system MqsA family antitoxin [Clostridia bacterium]|nr:type II toxin-antitoxin system MqsA family antitoxin [Clostridia bacterium]
MKCFKCKGEMTEGTTTFVADTDDCCIVVRHVPCMKCGECGEIAYSGKVSANLEKIVKAVRSAMAEVTVVNYREDVA